MRASFFLLLLLVYAGRLAAQDKSDQFELSDIPAEDVHPYFGVGGGFTVQMLALDLGAINTMAAKRGIGALDGNLILTGGEGFISAPFARNMRIGGGGCGGFVCTSNDMVDSLPTVGGGSVATNVRRTAQFTLGYGTVAGEYVVPLAFTSNHVVVVGGLQLGGGSMTIELDQTTSDPRTWDGFFGMGVTPNFTHTVHAAFFNLQPYVNLEYSPLAFLMVRVGAGYNGTVVGTWRADRDIDMSGVPSITGNGLALHTGVFVGIFR